MSTRAPTPGVPAPVAAEIVEQRLGGDHEAEAVRDAMVVGPFCEAPLEPDVVEEPLPESAPPVRIVPAESIEDNVEILDERGALIRLIGATGSAAEWCFGVLSLFAGLSVLATLPILQFLSLGYLLEMSGRIARTGRLRDGFVGVRKAARVGSIVLGTWLLLWPIRIVSDWWYSAHLIDPRSLTTRSLRVVLVLLTLGILAHILWAWFRGGRLRHFLWPQPIRFARRAFRGGKYVEARDATWDFLVALRLPYFFWLGFRGFVGALAWLFVPILLFIGATELPDGWNVASGFLGSLALAAVLVPLPFLQARFAVERRFTAMFEIGQSLRLFLRAPLAFWFALTLTLALAVPLYLAKIEWLQREVTWLLSPLFVASILPARAMTGWAVGLARRRIASEPPLSPARRLLRFFSWGVAGILTVPLVASYVFILFFTRYTSWNGPWGLFEQHAFMVPAPFIGG